MTNKTTMPEPVAFLNPYGGVLTSLTTGLERETFTIKLITTAQAEAYKDACVREALEEVVARVEQFHPKATPKGIAAFIRVIILKGTSMTTKHTGEHEPTDTEMLDWIIENEAVVSFLYKSRLYEVWFCGACIETEKTAREAIAKAMRGEK